MEIDRRDTAVVFTDPQNEVLSETGQAWPLVRESLAENNTIENMDRVFAAAKQHGFEVFISPHYFYPTDAGWIIKLVRVPNSFVRRQLEIRSAEGMTLARAGCL